MDRSFVAVGTYRLAQGNARNPETLFLKASKSNGQWRVEVFEKRPGQRSDEQSEVFSIDPDKKIIKPVFEKVSVGTMGPVPTPLEPINCGLATLIGPKANYSVCTTHFALSGGRVDWKAMATMLVNAGAPAAIDTVVIARMTPEYRRQFAAATNKAELQRFVIRYQNADPDGLVGKARARISELDAAMQEADVVLEKLPELKGYLPRFIPAKPAKYCVQFAPGSPEARVCRDRVDDIVEGLARSKAQIARREDFCKRVATKYVSDASKKCQEFSKTNACASRFGTDANATRTCDVLKSRPL
ncbi:hypothetical protein [Variovorax sp. N23]|uniref:hypothetical protein n=1 Tax=Variovorax sp. N23 TaxID=2980555 RepID=UPI0021C920E6|nr:hypothetical protein [Variovorax sp. N23]MCU4119744.1 hypothetical protein [Variovorax sp. N23]